MRARPSAFLYSCGDSGFSERGGVAVHLGLGGVAVHPGRAGDDCIRVPWLFDAG